MVTDVRGRINGADIIFLKQDGKWTAQVPSVPDGEYVSEIFATDEAGNVSFLCRMLFEIQGHSVKVVMLDKGYISEQITVEYQSKILQNGYFADLKREGFKIERTVHC